MGKKLLDDLCATRRQFLMAGTGVTATVLLSAIFPGTTFGARRAKFTKYPQKKIASLNQLKTDQPLMFNYPHEDPYSKSLIVKLGVRAAGGVGPNMDVVAFNTLCSHMGGLVGDLYKAEHKVLGPCPLHLTLFDLTRHGMVVAGHATVPLPQVVLEVKGNDIYATGLVGLIYGYNDNLG